MNRFLFGSVLALALAASADAALYMKSRTWVTDSERLETCR